MDGNEIYDLIYTELCDRIEQGEITMEFAEVVNDLAYDKYIMESAIDREIEDLKRKKEALKAKLDELKAKHAPGAAISKVYADIKVINEQLTPLYNERDKYKIPRGMKPDSYTGSFIKVRGSKDINIDMAKNPRHTKNLR